MAKFVKFEDLYDNPVYVNPDHVVCIVEVKSKLGNYFKLYLSTGTHDSIEVKSDTVSRILKRLEGN